MLKVIQYYVKNSLRNFNYIIFCEMSRKGIIIDPYDIDPLIDLCEQNNIKPTYLLNTHHHFDHIKDNDRALEEFGLELIKLKHEEVLELDSGEVKCIDTPGHVMDHQCFLIINNEEIHGIISGDTIFNAGVGNCKNGGDVKALYRTIAYLDELLPQETKVYPSHDYLLTNLSFSLSIEPDNQYCADLKKRREKMNLDEEFIQTTMEMEREMNPFFRAVRGELFNEDNLSEEEQFIKLRGLRDNW